MLRLQKQTISRFLSHKCKRQLYLNLLLTRDLNNKQHPKRIVRPAVQVSTERGNQWEAEKVEDIMQAFGKKRLIGRDGAQSVIGVSPRQLSLLNIHGQSPHLFDDISLNDAFQKVVMLGSHASDHFIVQGQYEVPMLFKQWYNLIRFTSSSNPLEFSDLRPDLIWIRSAGTYSQYITTHGYISAIPSHDTRLQLQVIDIKLASEPSDAHFAELTYYMITLVAWLIEKKLDNQFVVVPNGSVWPGSLDISMLMRLAQQVLSTSIQVPINDLNEALNQDLEPVPFEPLSQRLTTFFERDLVEVLEAQDWKTLPWHINQSCATCDFLGRDEDTTAPSHPNYCHVEATQHDRVVRIAFLGRGSKLQLEEQGVDTSDRLRLLAPQSAVFLDHNQLRAERNILISRAEALSQGVPMLLPGRQTIGLPEPGDCNLKIFLTLDFDPSSGLTYAFGVRTFWWAPRPKRHKSRTTQPPLPVQAAPHTPIWKDGVFIVQQRDQLSELTQLLLILETITITIAEVEDALKQNGYTGKGAIPKIQFYVWDAVQAKHIRRVMGRHMNNPRVQQYFQTLIWRFPPDTVLPNAELEKRSPASIVKTVIRQLVGLPIPYDYSLLQTARSYHPSSVPVNWFDVPALFESGLGDQIPFERAHEIWSGKGYRNKTSGMHISWNDLLYMMQRSVKAKLRALSSVVSKLEEDLARQNRLLLKPTSASIGRPVWLQNVSVDGQLWMNYAKLEVASREYETQAKRAMDVDEREARYHTAVLEEHLQGIHEQNAYSFLTITPRPGVRVYRLRSTSAEVKLEADDFLWALAPANIPGFLDRRVIHLTQQNEQLAIQLTGDPDRGPWCFTERYTRVTILEINRDQLLIAVLLEHPQFVEQVEQLQLADFSRDCVLDEVHADFWTDKLKRCLRAIGNPSIAVPAPQSRNALFR